MCIFFVVLINNSSFPLKYLYTLFCVYSYFYCPFPNVCISVSFLQLDMIGELSRVVRALVFCICILLVTSEVEYFLFIVCVYSLFIGEFPLPSSHFFPELSLLNWCIVLIYSKYQILIICIVGSMCSFKLNFCYILFGQIANIRLFELLKFIWFYIWHFLQLFHTF